MLVCGVDHTGHGYYHGVGVANKKEISLGTKIPRRDTSSASVIESRSVSLTVYRTCSALFL